MGLWVRRLTGVCAPFAATILLLIGSDVVHAACYTPQQQLPQQTIASFEANPAQLLGQFPNGGAQMISMIRDLIASDPATLPLILTLVPTASMAELNAIGAGLGQGALVCLRTDQAFANEIQQMVAAAGNQTVILALASVLGDQAIAAVGGPGVGIGGGAEGATGQNPITGGSFGGNSFNFNTSVNTIPTNFFTLDFNGSGSSPGVIPSTIINGSVSPSH
jgi:hypothetical protein